MHLLKENTAIFAVLLPVLLFAACISEAPGSSQSPWPAFDRATIPEDELINPAIITDRTGRDWDVTHARNIYGMNPDYFNYGLGIGAISSIDNPTVLEEGDAGYPDSGTQIPVFGVNLNGEQRAYRVGTLRRHEVINDVYPGEPEKYVAVTY
ncbi:DUF3179 domain-containing (seleno)protein [Chloroflexota bacterium]